MAIGKVFDHPLNFNDIEIIFGSGKKKKSIFFNKIYNELSNFQSIKSLLNSDKIKIEVKIGSGKFHEVVWGCDLSPKYIQINSEYST